MSVSILNLNFSSEEVKSYIEKFTSRIKNDQLSGSSLASKVKYITDTSGKSLVTIYVDGAKELFNMVNTPDMTDHDKDVNLKSLSMMFNTHILDVLKSLKNLSSELTLYGWKIDDVYPLIRNIFGFGGMNHTTNQPNYGVPDFRFVFYLSPDNSSRSTPLCNNTPREGTPMTVNSHDAPEFFVRTRNSRAINEDNRFTVPPSVPFDELSTPNETYAKTIVKSIVDHVVGNGSFASRSIKWKQDKRSNECLTRIMIDYSKSVDIEVRKKLPRQFFHITYDATKDFNNLPSASAQQVVRKITCEESLRFLANWSLIMKELSVSMQTSTPTIGWRATSLYALVYDRDRFVGKNEKGGSSSLIYVQVTPNLVGEWEGKRPLCNNTVLEGFPMIVDTVSTSSDSSRTGRNNVVSNHASTYGSPHGSSHASPHGSPHASSHGSNYASIASTYASTVNGHRPVVHGPPSAARRVVTGVTGRR